MASQVYFARAGGHPRQGSVDRLHMLFESAGFASRISDRDLVAVKVHFGESGGTSFVPPHYIRPVVEDIIACGGRPFLTDTGCLYFSRRYNARDHVMVAAEHGFSLESTGAPVVIADGLRGSDVKQVRVGLKHLQTVDVASGVRDANSLVVCTHITGHGLTGFAGTIKNLGMGAAGRRMKLSVHQHVWPTVNQDLCTVCGNCRENCPAHAVEVVEGRVEMDPDRCIGCGECVALCPERAVKVIWKGDPGVAQEQLAEITFGVLADKRDRCCFLAFLINITPTCDCWNYSAAAMAPDLGFLASTDPVAIDQAAADLVGRAAPAGPDIFRAGYGIDWTRQLEYAESIGLGTREYRLTEVGS